MMTQDWWSRWQALDHWLAQYRPLWATVPFSTPEPDWLRAQPAAARWLEALDEVDCEQYSEDLPALAKDLSPFWPELAERASLLAVPVAEAPATPLAESRARDMPGRKRLQAGAFAAALTPLESRLIDWCCGKGHLGRTLVACGAEAVTGLEWNPELVVDGNTLAARDGAAVTIRQQDVLASGWSLPEADQVVALHACGELHRQLLRQGSEDGLARLSVSPCCYHLGVEGHYPLLSRRAREAARVSLDAGEMRVVVQETVTAPARVRRQRQTVSAWRLGFDGLQRQVRGQDHYLPVPPHPAALNRADFRDFCLWAAERKSLALPEDTDYPHWLAHGWRRLHQVRCLELVRHLFRRPLELWLVLDYALYLEEQGYRVSLREFCRRPLTPRNLLLDARRG